MVNSRITPMTLEQLQAVNAKLAIDVAIKEAAEQAEKEAKEAEERAAREAQGLPEPQPEPARRRTNPTGERWAAHDLINEAVSKFPGARNNGGFYLACQLRDEGYIQSEAEQALRDYVLCVPGGGDSYTESEALASVRQAYKRMSRDARTRQESAPSTNGATPSADRPAHLTPSQQLIAELNDMGYTFAQNELDDVIFVGGERLDSALAAKIKTQIRDLFSALCLTGETPEWRVTWIEDAYTGAAYDNRFHPVKEYLENLIWDQQEHYIAKLAKHFTCIDPDIIYPAHGDIIERKRGTFALWLRKWMIGTVAKALNPSAQTQVPMLVIVGKQGDGKSTFAQWLGSGLPQLTIESPIQPDSADHLRYLSSTWIWEVAELGATTRRSDVEALKAFITKIDATFRKPYDKHPITKPALASFVGTVNDGVGFLSDITGNRRFLVTRIAHIDWDYINIDIDQLWAEAVHAYYRGESWHLTDVEAKHRDKLNSGHEQEDTYEGHVLKYFEIDKSREDWQLPTSEIVSIIQAMGVTGGTRAIQMGVASYLKKRDLQQHWGRPRAWIGIRKRP